jgi:hypothetical protein
MESLADDVALLFNFVLGTGEPPIQIVAGTLSMGDKPTRE